MTYTLHYVRPTSACERSIRRGNVAGEMSGMICDHDKSDQQTRHAGTDQPEAATISVSNYYDTLHRTTP